MEDIISLKRVWLIIRAHVLTNVRKYVLYALSIPIIMISVWMILYVWGIDLKNTFLIYANFAFFVILSFSVIWFSKPLRSAPANTIELIRPYSVLDRILSVIIWMGVVQVGYFIIVTCIFVLLINGFFDGNPLFDPIDLKYLAYHFKIHYGGIYIYIAALYAYIISYCLMYFAGGVFFKKAAWVKTYFILFLFSSKVMDFLLFYALHGIIDGYTPGVSFWRLYSIFSIVYPQINYISAILHISISTILVWLALREKQA